MNIFFLDPNPRIAAEYHCDKHVVKMILESAQLLYCAHWVLNPTDLPENAYKKAHMNHPCSIWVRESIENYIWLCELAIELCKEYTFRYQKIHKTQQHIEWLKSNPPLNIPDGLMTQIRLAMPNEYKYKNPIKSYREFYRESKMKQRGIVTYTKREWPTFLL
jgi:Pyrimidine dimer DNA glycosylase